MRQAVQEALEKTRSFSQALHPTILDDYGLEKAIERYLPTVERQAGIAVRFEKQGSRPYCCRACDPRLSDPAGGCE